MTIVRRTAALMALAGLLASPAGATGLAYPPAAPGSVAEDHFGTSVPDPYRWMESIDSPQVTDWVKAENALSRSYFDAIPARAAIKEKFRTLYNYEKVGVPFREGKRWYTYYNSGLQNQYVLYVNDTPSDKGHVFLDPNTLSKDGTVALGPSSFTEDGKLYAYATQTAGSDWETWHVRDTATGNDLADTIEWSKFSGASWLGDTGFYYSRFAAPKDGKLLAGALANQQVFFHKLGTPQAADKLIYTRPDHPDWFLGASVTRDQRYLMIGERKGSKDGLVYRDLKKPGSAFTTLFKNGVATYGIVDHDGTKFYVETTQGAPRARLTYVDLLDPTHALHDILPQRAQPLESVSLIGNTFYVSYLQDAHAIVEIHSLDGKKIGDLATPGVGSMGPPSARREDTTAYYSYSSYSTPATVYKYDVKTGTSSVAIAPKIAFDATQYTTDEVFATSKDGTKIPLFISHKKGIALDGTAPTILYAYGGFDISILPAFSTSAALWMQMGGVYAVASLRGGDEYGEAWHEAGMLDKKQNVFDDFYASAHYLIDNKWTSPAKLAASGASNGGLLVGTAITQHPELWGAALPGVGVMDLLRFHKFTVGAAWIPEYGSADANEQQFKTLYAYSPYANTRPGVKYPPTLVTTADHDDRVFPAHSFKFAAKMQADQAGDAPILISIETKAGHGGGKPTDKIIDELADSYAFLVKNLNFTPTL